jgi:hypothetical protein
MEPLTGEKEQRKKPIILYIIIGVLLIAVIVLSILLGIKSGKKEEKNEVFNPIKEDHFIKITDSFYIDDPEFGANSYHGCGNHLESEYFKILDIYNMKPNANRSILTHFKTYQQTSEYSSPCSLIIMILNYYNMEAPGERNCSLTFGLTPEEGCSKDNYDRTEVFNKTTIPLFAKQLTETYHLEVDICQNYNEETMPFKNEAEFGDWVKKQISEENIPIVLYNDWAGQYAAIIGIDNLGTPDTNDDVLILADAYDTTDHLQDGYTVWSLEKFYNLWQYSVIPFYKDDESINHGQWILVKKPKSN